MKSESLLVIVSVGELEGELTDIMRRFSESKKTGIFICLNKPAAYRRALLQRQRIDDKNIFMVDAVSGQEEKKDNTTYLSEISTKKIIETLKTVLIEKPKKEYIVIESLRTLQIYEEEKNILSFLKEVKKITIEKGITVLAIVTSHADYGNFLSYFTKVIDVK